MSCLVILLAARSLLHKVLPALCSEFKKDMDREKARMNEWRSTASQGLCHTLSLGRSRHIFDGGLTMSERHTIFSMLNLHEHYLLIMKTGNTADKLVLYYINAPGCQRTAGACPALLASSTAIDLDFGHLR